MDMALFNPSRIPIIITAQAAKWTSDQMVSLSFKSIESFVKDDNLVGLKTFLVSRSVVIDDRDENGITPLILCSSLGKTDFCREFVAHGADIYAEDNDQWNCLISAAKEGHNETVKLLLEHGASLEHKDIGGWTSLMWACYKGHTETAQTLLHAGANPNVQGQHHMTSLIWASGRGYAEIVDALLTKGAKANVGDKFGTTPLIWASRKGYIEIAELLIQKGGHVDATGMYSWTPLLVATKGNYVELVQLLLEKKPNLNALDKDGGTALTTACKEGYSEIAFSLLQSGAAVNIQDRNGDTNLIYASRGGHRNVVELLLKKYVDTDIVGKDRKTALYWAVEKGHTSVVKLLLSSNADLEVTTKDGDTSLLRAVRSKKDEIVQLLIDKKARVNVSDKKGDTALHIAMRARSKHIVEILLRNPKNSQMLYRPNRAGETPYNIDLSNQKTILGQIFGARRINTNEENENMLGYDLYSSSMADILSEPSLSMPISVGLYARWGSGKSFLIRKLKEEMNSFAHQWVEPLFEFTPLVFLLILFISVIIGFISLISSKMWYVGLAVTCVATFISMLFFFVIWYGSRTKYDWNIWYSWSVSLYKQISSLKLVLHVMFCSPPGSQWKEWKDGVQAKPLKFIFAEGAKPTGTGPGANAVIQIVASLFDMVEHQYGIFSTRFYRAFRPKPHGSSSPWKYRRLCGIPYVAIFFTTILSGLVLTYLAVTYGFYVNINNNQITSVDQTDPQTKSVQNSPTVEFRNKRTFILDDDEEDDDDDEDDLINSRSAESVTTTAATIQSKPLQRRLITPLLFFLSILLAVVFVANIHTLARMIKSLMFSHRRHLMSSVSKFDTLSVESYLPTLKSEVVLLIDMVKGLDAFTGQQTRLVVILDGLDSCEQEKVLSVLDAVHTIFTDSRGPFIILLAIDPHIITRAIELNATKVFRESSISGHDYLRNVIHLPFYLQNAGLRKVKLAEKAAENMKGRRPQTTWNEQETEFVSLATTSAMGGLHHIPNNRRLSSESSMSLSIRRNASKNSRRLRASDSVGSSVASNLNRAGAASDLNKVLLTDDYFSDINPRSMRRLMNVVYITGRLLKAFHIEFNWYHLALWVNITEQWPYRASWLIYYYEKNEDSLDERHSLKEIYERVRCQIPTVKEVSPLVEMDKDEKKLETFLSMHEGVLHVFDLIVFLPFTINLDPFIKKKIKESNLKFDESHSPIAKPQPMLPWNFGSHIESQTKANPGNWFAKSQNIMKQYPQNPLPPSASPLMWGYPPLIPTPEMSPYPYQMKQSIPTISNSNIITDEMKNKKLSHLSLSEITEMFESVEGVSVHMLPVYKEKLTENNVNGKVLLHCNLEDLKPILKMNFGDWELFKILVLSLREHEINQETSTPVFVTSPPSYSAESETDFDTKRRGSTRSNKSEETNAPRKQNKNPMHVKQVNLEEQMIFGALQTLNEEAFEDVLEEQMKFVVEEPVREAAPNEVDVVYIQSSPFMTHKVVSCSSDCESVAPSVDSCYSPYKESISRASSLKRVPGKHTDGELSRNGSLKMEKTKKRHSKIYFEDECGTSCEDIDKTITENEVNNLNFADLNSGLVSNSATLSSLPDILTILNKSSEHISSSSSSIDKLKKLKQTLQKVLISSDHIDKMGDEYESSPLVLDNSPTNSCPAVNTYVNCSNDILEDNSDSVNESSLDGSSKTKTETNV